MTDRYKVQPGKRCLFIKNSRAVLIQKINCCKIKIAMVNGKRSVKRLNIWACLKVSSMSAGSRCNCWSHKIDSTFTATRRIKLRPAYIHCPRGGRSSCLLSRMCKFPETSNKMSMYQKNGFPIHPRPKTNHVSWTCISINFWGQMKGPISMLKNTNDSGRWKKCLIRKEEGFNRMSVFSRSKYRNVFKLWGPDKNLTELILLMNHLQGGRKFVKTKTRCWSAGWKWM